MKNDIAKALELAEDSCAQPGASHGTPVDYAPTPISGVRKMSLYSFIGFLALSALFAIVCVIRGEFGEFEVKVLVTTLVIAAGSICSLCCSAYAGRTHNTWPALGGIGVATLAGALLILGVWMEIESEPYWKDTAVLGVLAAACAHALALLALRLKPEQRWLQVVTSVNIALLALVISSMILGEVDNEDVLKVVVVLAILAALGTLVVPILSRLARAQPDQPRAELLLTPRDDGTYEDKHGRVYTVTEVPDRCKDTEGE